MAIPTDRGYVILSESPDGQLTVRISASQPVAGKADDVFAEHVGESRVRIDPSVQLVKHGKLSWTTSPVQVFVSSAGTVNITPARSAVAS
jgi:hypothetical protein